MPAKFFWIPIAIGCAMIFSWSVYRDIHLEKRYAGDLRNRIVGARLQQDGRSPYFYKWKNGDGFRYYDPNNFDSLQVSNITASPFFHVLLYPIANLPQRTISVVWLLAEYGMLLAIIVLALAIANNRQQQWMIVVTACLVLLTEAWKMHIGNGQNYLCLVFLAMLFYYSIRKTTWHMALLAGVCATMLLLIKPTTGIFFIPFLFLLKRYPLRWLGFCMLPLLMAGIGTVTSSRQVFLWKQYKENITQQIKLHQHESPEVQKNDPDPAFPDWEGISRQEIKRQGELFPDKIFSENGNAFVMVQQLVHQKPGKQLLAALSGCCMVLLLLTFYFIHRREGFTLTGIALVGFCMFMIADLFSPVYRHQYYAVQWLFPLLLSAAVYQPAFIKIYIILAAGLVLNIINIALLPMEHSIGEYIMLVGFIVLSLQRKTHAIQ